MDLLTLLFVISLVVLLGLCIFFYFVKPNVSIGGVNVKYALTALFALIGSLFLFFLKSKNDNGENASLERKLRDQKIETDLAVNRHLRAQNEKRVQEIDEEIMTIDRSVSENDSQVKELIQERDKIKEQIKDLENKNKNNGNKSAEQIANDISKHLGD